MIVLVEQYLAGRRRSPMLCALLLLAVTAMGYAGKPVIAPVVVPERVVEFRIKTRSDENKELPFYLRRPLNYRPGTPVRLCGKHLATFFARDRTGIESHFRGVNHQ